MKNLFLTTILAFSLFVSIAQNPYKFLRIENNQFIYEAIFSKDSLNASQIETLLLTNLPMAKSVTNVRGANGLITANLVNLLIDYKKYGGSFGGTAIFMQNPLNANVTILIKDGKYKVTVTSIVFMVDMHGSFGINISPTSAESMYLKNDLTDYKTRSGIVESGGYMEQQFNDIFLIKPIKSDW